jgi:hypothetical protein
MLAESMAFWRRTFVSCEKIPLASSEMPFSPNCKSYSIAVHWTIKTQSRDRCELTFTVTLGLSASLLIGFQGFNLKSNFLSRVTSIIPKRTNARSGGKYQGDYRLMPWFALQILEVSLYSAVQWGRRENRKLGKDKNRNPASKGEIPQALEEWGDGFGIPQFGGTKQ